MSGRQSVKRFHDEDTKKILKKRSKTGEKQNVLYVEKILKKMII